MIQREQPITWILRLEADGKEHNGDEIDQYLRKAAKELGYTESDLEKKHGSNRGMFENDSDWAKAEMTRDKLHEIVKPARGKQPNVYRITEKGQEELRERQQSKLI
jgi:Mrr N-terminal domain